MQGAFHDKAVGTHGREDVVHLREGLYNPVAFQRSRHIEEHDVRFHFFFGKHPFGIVKGVEGVACNDRIGVLPDLAEVVTCECLEIEALVDKFRFTFTQSVDAVLRGIAVYDGDIVTLHVVEVAGGKCRDGRFSDASLLCCECNEDFITHGSIAFNG